MPDAPELSVVIPAMNEEENIHAMHDRLVAALEAVDVPVHRLRVAHELAALELAPREVVVLELNAPLLGHLETLLDLHAREPTCRAVLALSADRRAQGFCMKPVDPELLLALLESLPRG